MASWICAHCGSGFTRDKSGSRPIRFCGQSCYRAWVATQPPNDGTFKPGIQPWNKGVKGLHLSQATEFVAGHCRTVRAAIGEMRIRCHKDDKHRAWVKIADPNVWRLRAVVNWELEHGPAPAGMLVHHRNRDTLDDEAKNLELQSRAEHLLEHRPEFEKRRLQRLRAALCARLADVQQQTTIETSPQGEP